MRIRPGQNLISVYTLLTALAVTSIFWTPMVWVCVAIFVASLIMVAVSALSLAKRIPKIDVKRRVPKSIGRDVEFLVELEIVNRNANPVTGTIRDDLPPESIPNLETMNFTVAGDEATELKSLIRIPIRGLYSFEKTWVELSDTLGLISVQFEKKLESEVRVLPEVFCSEEGLQQSTSASIQLLDKLKVARQNGVGTEFESLAEFREGDDERRVDWRATARMQHPVIRRYQIERHRDVMILVDCGRLMGQKSGTGTKLDCAIDAGLMLARVALNGGDRCGMGLFDDRVRGFVPPLSGAHSIQMLTECLYNAPSEMNESNFSSMFGTIQSKQQKRSLIIILSDVLDIETSVRYRNSLASLARQHLVLFCALKTPLLTELIQDPHESILDGFETAVSYRLLRERRATIQSIHQSGVHVMDREPEGLSVPLINHFIELRQSNSL